MSLVYVCMSMGGLSVVLYSGKTDRTISMKKNENSNEQEMENRTKDKKTTDIYRHGA